ncbi:MAG TPA: hypothetical protein VFF81_05955 [Noviherbaspirillum sp.]|nr:hypothetical protein [Noviherbaspirillum sp.]
MLASSNRSPLSPAPPHLPVPLWKSARGHNGLTKTDRLSDIQIGRHHHQPWPEAAKAIGTADFQKYALGQSFD